MHEFFSFKTCFHYYVPGILKHWICIQLFFTRREKNAEMYSYACTMHLHWLGTRPNDAILPAQVANQNTEFTLLFPTHILLLQLYWWQSAQKWGFPVNISGECKCHLWKSQEQWLWFPLKILHFSHKKRGYNYSRNHSCHLTKPKLRTWLSYPVGTAKDGSTLMEAKKHELMHRWAAGCWIILVKFSCRNKSFILSQTSITFIFVELWVK